MTSPVPHEEEKQLVPVDEVHDEFIVDNPDFQDELRNEIQALQVQKQIEFEEIEPPPTDQYQITHVPLTNQEMETIKLAAQFVAKNGNQFLMGLTQREIRNPRFDFLKPTHPLFTYFTALVESYSRVLQPKSESLQRFEAFAQTVDGKGLEECRRAGEHRQLYMDQTERLERLEEAQNQDQFAAEDSEMTEEVDWFDFVVVEQIELYDDQEMTEQQEAQQSMQREQDAKKSEQIQRQVRQHMQENEELKNMPDPSQVALEGEGEPEAAAAGTTDNLPKGSALDPEMKVVKNYVRKTADDVATEEVQKSEGTQKCPNCKQLINKSDWRQHFKICIQDPKVKEQKKLLEERRDNAAYAGADDITQNLRRLASKRPDIFGHQQAPVVAQPAQVQQSADGNPIIWDGQSQSITRTTANIAMMRNQQQNNLKEILQKRGELDNKSLEYLQQHQNNQMLQSSIIQKDIQKKNLQVDHGPAQGQADYKTEEEWVQISGTHVNVTLIADASAQTYLPRPVTMRVELMSQVQDLKDQLSKKMQQQLTPEAINIQLLNGGATLNDAMSLAYYNVAEGCQLIFGSKK